LLPPPPLRLLPGGAIQFPGGFISRCGPVPFTAHCYRDITPIIWAECKSQDAVAIKPALADYNLTEVRLMTTPGGQPNKMYFELRYITTDFDFKDKQISVSGPEKKMTFLLRKRVPEDAPLPAIEAFDGLVTVTCEREMTDRLHQEAASSGRLSIKKEAVRRVHDEMFSHMLRTIRVIRWRASSEGKPYPIRSTLDVGFRWSFDRSDWKPVENYISFRISVHVRPKWSDECDKFLVTETPGELDEPVGHELLREAWANRAENPRSSIVLAVAAAEVGFKQFASKVLPDSAWILESVQSPPLVKMLKDLFPWSRLNVRINGQNVTPPDSVTTTLEKAVHLRNDIVHGRAGNVNGKTATSVWVAVRDLLYFLDFAQGHQWALYHLSGEARKHFPQVTSWPLRVDPLV